MAYIAESDPDAAVTIAQSIWDHTQQLDRFPGLGRPGRVSGTRELVVPHTAFVVPYRVVKDVVEILRVLHGARQWPESFFDAE